METTIQDIVQAPELNWKTVHLKRGDYYIRAGEKEKHLGFVIKGALRAYTLSETEEFTIRFAYANSIVAAIPAFFSEEPSDVSIQAIRQSQIILTSKLEFEQYMSESKERLLLYNSLLKDLMSSFYEREVDLLTQAPAERIARILKRSPQVFQEIPHRYIASYLRMSAETLSRLLKS